MSFLQKDNYLNLIENVECEIIGDSIINCWMHYLLPNKELIATFDATGIVEYNGERIISGETKIDYRKPLAFVVKNGTLSTTYKVYIHSFTGLPVMCIETEGRQDIVSKEDYLKAKFKLVEGTVTRSAGDVIDTNVYIKGRGNSSWERPKKSYSLKFETKVSLLNEPTDKSWVLIPNYSDKTSLRNSLAFFMGQHSNLEYTPRAHFVELFLNGRYHGLYLLSEKIKESKDRVNIGKNGFLLEIDARAEMDPNSRVFHSPHITYGIDIKEPECDIGDENYYYIKQFINEVDSVLFSDKFKDPINGWQKYLDVNSFVDWYLINEIANNQDAKEFSSIYMSYIPGGRLKMGPIWDFDIAFGNCYYQYYYDVLRIKTGQWYSRLFEDPFFVQKVTTRFMYFYESKDHYLKYINEMASYLKWSVQENENRWQTFYVETPVNYDIWGTYENEIQMLKIWLEKRLEWMKQEFDNY